MSTPAIHNPHVRAALSTMTRAMLLVGLVLCSVVAVWGVYIYPFAPTDQLLASIVVAEAAVVLLLGASWLGMRLAASHDMDTMMVWVAGGFLVRVLIVAGAVIGSSLSDLNVRFIASAIIIAVLAGMFTEVITLKRAKITTVSPPAPNTD